MNVLITYGSRASLRTTTKGMQRVLANNEVMIVENLASAMIPQCNVVETRVKDTLYQIRV